MITYRNRWTCFGVVFVYAWVLYFLSNHQSVVAVHVLPLTIADLRTPFLPWTVWIYATVFVLPLFACAAAKTDEDVKALVFSFAGMITLDTFFFMAYPTVYPRPAMGAASWSASALAAVRYCDTAANCCPSQHVGVAFLTAFHVRRLSKTWGPACFLLAVAIALSTLTTKQHYLWDVIAGAPMAAGSYRLLAGGSSQRSATASAKSSPATPACAAEPSGNAAS